MGNSARGHRITLHQFQAPTGRRGRRILITPVNDTFIYSIQVAYRRFNVPYLAMLPIDTA
jgi:hypothetical protein